MDNLELYVASASGIAVAVGLVLKRVLGNGNAQQPVAQTARLPDPFIDTANRLLSPQGMTDTLLRMDRRIESLSDRTNGHGAARREHLERLERKVDRTVATVDAMSEQISEVRADVAYLKGAREADDIIKVPVK